MHLATKSVFQTMITIKNKTMYKFALSQHDFYKIASNQTVHRILSTQIFHLFQGRIMTRPLIIFLKKYELVTMTHIQKLKSWLS